MAIRLLNDLFSLPTLSFITHRSSRTSISIFRTPVLPPSCTFVDLPPSFVLYRQQHVFRELRPDTSMSEMMGTRRYHLYTLPSPASPQVQFQGQTPTPNALYQRSEPSMRHASRSHPPNTPAPYQIPTFLPRISNTPLHHRGVR